MLYWAMCYKDIPLLTLFPVMLWQCHCHFIFSCCFINFTVWVFHQTLDFKLLIRWLFCFSGILISAVFETAFIVISKFIDFTVCHFFFFVFLFSILVKFLQLASLIYKGCCYLFNYLNLYLWLWEDGHCSYGWRSPTLTECLSGKFFCY